MDSEQDRILSIVRDFKKEISRKIRLDKCILFGSRACGKEKEYSDIDLLLVSNDFQGKKYFKRSPELYLMWNFHYDVDILCLTPSEFDRKKNSIGIIRDASVNGIEI